MPVIINHEMVESFKVFMPEKLFSLKSQLMYNIFFTFRQHSFYYLFTGRWLFNSNNFSKSSRNWGTI